MTWNVNASKDEIGVLMEAGIVYRESGKFAEARQVFEGVQALLPKSDAARVALGTVDFQQGDFEGAARHYRLALELNPRSAYAQAHLGEVEIFRKDKEKAREHLREAIRLDPHGTFGKFARSLLKLADVVQYKEEAV